MILLWGVQKALYQDVDFFVANTEKGSQQFFSHRARGPAHVTAVALLFSQAAPVFDVTNKGYLTLQPTGLGSYTVARPFRISLGLTLAGQLALVQAYGTETFLYALNFTVLLVLLASLAARTRARPAALALAAIVTVAGAADNYPLRTQAAKDAHTALQDQAQRMYGQASRSR